MINKSTLIVFIFLLSCFLIQAQSAYHGGKGDGYARAVISLKNVSVKENSNLGIKIFPNPAMHELHIIGAYENGLSYEILNLNGQNILNGNIKGKQSIIDISHFMRGVYMIRIVANDEVFSKKLLIN